jgi:4-amino-4-deoxy-L-arabinose transferase-like glycosyltransferase
MGPLLKRRGFHPTMRRLAAYLVVRLERQRSGLAVGFLIACHVVAWTAVLTIAKRGQELHGDSTEAYAWGTRLLWGYGKHPPLTGWIARLWFSLFPTTNWAMYALAMTAVGCTLFLCWLIAAKVTGRRRAALYVLSLMVYPVFNFSAFNFNPDLLQLPAFALATLTAIVALGNPSFRNGVFLGIACALAVLTKYWALLLLASIAVAAVIHPRRAVIWRSPAAVAAPLTFICLLIPHAVWLIRSGFAPIRYAADYTHQPEASNVLAALASLGHHAATLLAPGTAIALAVGWPWCRPPAVGRRGDEGATRFIRTMVAVLVLLPPVAAVALHVHTRSSWGTPLYFLVPLVALGVPALGIPARALVRAAILAFGFTAAMLLVSPLLMPLEARFSPRRYTLDGEDLANKVTRLWHQRFHCPLPTVAGPAPAVAPIAFYSADHPVIFTDADPRIATWIDLRELHRTGFVGICPNTALHCIKAIGDIAVGAEQTVLSQERVVAGRFIRGVTWSVFLSAPAGTDDSCVITRRSPTSGHAHGAVSPGVAVPPIRDPKAQ